MLEAARRHPHWKAPLGANQGRGVACGFWFNAGLNSSATITLDGDGSAAVFTGNPDIGGTRVAQALMVAEELGIPVERVRPTVADTDAAGYTDVTGGSRVCYATGMAVIEAARDVREQLRARAAKIWNIDVSNVGWEGGRARSAERRRRSVAAHADASSPPRPAHTGGPIIGRAALNVADGRARRSAPTSATSRSTRKPDAARSSATRRSRTSARRCIPASSKGRCRAARRRASAGR